MSGIIGSAGTKSGLIGIEIGDSSVAYMTTGQTNAGTTHIYTPWAFMVNDNPSLYKINTWGITISVSGTYMVDISIFSEGRSTSTHNYAYFSHSSSGTAPTWDGHAFICLDDASSDGHSGRMTQTASKPLTLVAGTSYGMKSSQNSGTRNLPVTGMNSLGLTLLRIG